MASLEVLMLTQELIREVRRYDRSDINIIRDLLQRGANINGRDDDKDDWYSEAPLMILATNGDESLPIIVELLKHENLDLNAQVKYGDTALIAASLRGYAEVVRTLLKDGRVEVNGKDKHGGTALMNASHFGHPEVVRILLEDNRVDVDVKDSRGRTALIIASQGGKQEVVKVLLKDGKVDVNAKDNDGKTGLIWAIRCGREEVVDVILKDDRMDINATDNQGRTALIEASYRDTKKRNRTVGILLKDDRVEVNATDYRGHSAFFWANYCGSPNTIRMFLNHGRADVNAAGGAIGNTALMWACLRGQDDIVSELLAFPMVDVQAKNKAGSTALDIARELQMLEIARLLEARAEFDSWRDL